MAQDGRTLPLKIPRLALLLLTWCLAIVGGSVGLNSVIKRNQLVARVKAMVSGTLNGVRANINTHDLEDPGIVLAVGCAVLAVIASAWIGLLLLDMFRKKNTTTSDANTNTRAPLSTRTLPIQWMSMGFMSIWLLACLIPVTYYAAQGSAKTTATLNGQPLPDSFVQAAADRLGIESEYWSLNFVRIQIIPPWFTFASSLITTIVLFLASKRRSGSDSTHAFVPAPAHADRTSKESAEEKEKHGETSPISPTSLTDKQHHEHASAAV